MTNIANGGDSNNLETDARNKELLDAALGYAALGWKVFPVHSIADDGRCTCGNPDCKSPGKHPRTGNGFKAATTDENLIRTWWGSGWAGSNIGCHCDSEFWVLDMDPRHDGHISLERLQAANDALPNTVTSITGGGGKHYLLKKTGDYEIATGANDTGELSGLDSRSTNGYAVLPPSKHASGQFYHWEDGQAPGEVEIPPAPTWLAEKFAKKTASEKSARNSTRSAANDNYRLSDAEVIKLLSYLDPDLIYDEWAKVGMALHSGGYPFDLWHSWSQKGDKYTGTGNCSGHWSSFDADEKITMGTLIYMGKLAGWTPPWHGPQGSDAPIAPAPSGPEKARPAPAVSPPPDGFLNPPGICKAMADYMTGIGKMPQPIFSVGASLTVMATILGNKFSTESGSRPNLMIVSIGPTASGKEAGRTGSKEVLVQSCLSDRIGGEDVTSGSAIEAVMKREANSLFLFDEFGLKLKAINNPRAANYEREIASMLMKFFQASGSLYVGKAYADQLVKERIRIQIANPCLSIYGTTTGESFDEALKSGDAASGFLNRFLFAETDTPVPDPQTPRPANDVPQLILDWTARVMALPRPGEGDLADTDLNAGSAIVVPKNDAARQLVDEFEIEVIARRRARNSELEHMLWGRSVEMVEKIAMILAVGADPEKLEITPEHVKWAIDFVTWSTNGLARRLSEFVADTEAEATLKRLVRLVKSASDYNADKRYGRACRAGVMPHSKLLKLSRLKKRDFDDYIATAIEARLIECFSLDNSIHGIEGRAYRALD